MKMEKIDKCWLPETNLGPIEPDSQGSIFIECVFKIGLYEANTRNKTKREEKEIQYKQNIS